MIFELIFKFYSDDPLFLEGLDKFYSTVVQNEMPYYDEIGICYRKRK